MATRTITITRLNPIKTGARKDGKGNWTLSEMSANNDQGQPIQEKLKTFSEFELNKPIEVELEKEEHPTFGVSFLVKPIGKYATRKELASLTERLEYLEGAVEELRKASGDTTRPDDQTSDLEQPPF